MFVWFLIITFQKIVSKSMFIMFSNAIKLENNNYIII